MADLAANALTTLDAVKDELGITVDTYDDYLTRKINVASSAIEDYCDRSFGKAVVTETFRAEGQLTFVVSRRPIVEVTAVKYDDVEIGDENYKIEDAAAGVIRLLYGAADMSLRARSVTADRLAGTARKLYAVTYTGGYVLPKDPEPTLPAAIDEACVQQVVSEYRQRGRDRAVVSERLMSWNATYAQPSSAENSGLAPQVLALVRPYRRVYV